MSRPPRRRVDASRLYLAGMVVAALGCLVQVIIAVGHAPALLAPVTVGAGGFAATTAATAWIAEGRWRWRTAEALAVAVAALIVGPVLAHLHATAVVTAFVVTVAALADGLRPARATSR